MFACKAAVHAVQVRADEQKAPTCRLINLLLSVYIYDDVQDTFKQLPGMPAHLHMQIHNATKALELFDKGTTRRSFVTSRLTAA